MVRLLLILLAVGLLPSPAQGEFPSLPKLNKKSDKPSRGRDVSPKLSRQGRRAAIQDLNVLNGNISKVRRNLKVARKNLLTLQAERKELLTIKASHEKLQQRMEEYIRVASASLERNEAAKQDLRAMEAELAPQLDDSAAKQKAADLKVLAGERETWKEDTKRKQQKVQQLEAELEQNLIKVAARISPIEEQIEEWKQKIQQLDAELDRMQLQKRRLTARTKK